MKLDPFQFYYASSPSNFQGFLKNLFRDLECQLLILYVDGIVGLAFFVGQYVQCLDMALGLLQWDGLKTKLEKYAFFQEEVKYLVSAMLSLVREYQLTQVQLKQLLIGNGTLMSLFLQFSSYHWHFVEGIAKLATPLHKQVLPQERCLGGPLV